MRFLWLLCGLTLSLAAWAAEKPSAQADEWAKITTKARGQTVYWHAWAGDSRINQFIAWVSQEVNAEFGIQLVHVKITDLAETVTQLIAEKAAGRLTDGRVDLMWINGENFAALKREDLLFGPWTDKLPHYPLIDFSQPTVSFDFTIPVDGLEMPWGMAQIVFMYDREFVEVPPHSIAQLFTWATANPGRFAYPQIPNFLGSTFLKQALVELTTHPDTLYRAVENNEQFQQVTAPLWDYLDALHPQLWGQGRVFPANGPAARQLLADGEISMALSFHPPEATAAIKAGELPNSIRTFILKQGTIGNTHFVAIPANAQSKEAAMVVANFLLSPTAQVRKQNPDYWGDLTVLDPQKLSAEYQKRFAELDGGLATLTRAELGKIIPELHPSWMTELEREWQRRYGTGR